MLRRTSTLLLPLAAGLMLAGCRSAAITTLHIGHLAESAEARAHSVAARPRPQTHSVETSAKPLPETADDAGELRLAADEVEVAPVPELPTDRQEFAEPLRFSVQHAIETALMQNPDLVAQHAAEDVSVAALGVAETYPFNPFVQVQATPVQNDVLGRSGKTYHYVLVMQQIQLAHQQEYREEVAGAQLNSVRWTILQQQLLVVAQTERLYFTAAYLDGLRDLAEAAAENNEQLLTILERQLDAGAATAADVAMVRLDARSTRQQLRLAEANYQTALLDLRRQLGLSQDVPLELTSIMASNLTGGSSPQLFPSESLAWLDPDQDPGAISNIVAGRPDVMAALADVNAARANVSLANANRVPDVQVGPYYQRTFDGTEFLGFRGQMDIPIMNSGKPLLRQRDAELHQRTTVWRQLHTRAELEAQAALDRYRRALEMLADVDLSPDQGLPIEFQRLEEQFLEGEVDVLRVFQARNSLIQNRRAQLDSLNELYQSAANVTAATGLPLESLFSLIDLPKE